MMKRDGATTRRDRLRDIANQLKNANRYPKRRILAWIQFNWGLTPKKAKEYLQVLIDLELVVERDGFLYDPKNLKEEGDEN